MKKLIGTLVVIAFMIITASPVSASSLGVSPSHIEVEVPQGGSTPVNFQVYYFSGELHVSLVDIPLEIEPKVFHIASSPTDIVVTFRDNTLAPQEYDGYVRFLGMSGDTVALAVNIEARVTVELTANIIEKPTPAGGGGGAPPAPVAGITDLTGKVSIFPLGVFLSSVTAISEDGLCTLTVPKDTIGLTGEQKRLTEIAMLIMDEPPAPPEDTHVIGLAYDFGPDGAIFYPAITLEFSYDPADIPEGVAEEDLVLAYYDEATGEWVELEGCVVDTENNTITASVSHFTTFAIIGAVTPPPAPAAFSVSDLSIQPAEVEPNEAVTIIVSVANTGGTEGSYSVVLKINGVKEEEKSVTVAAGSSEDVSFSVTKEDAGSYSVVVDELSGNFTVVTPPPVKPPINWPLIGGIIAAVVVAVGLLVFFLVRRRAYGT